MWELENRKYVDIQNFAPFVAFLALASGLQLFEARRVLSHVGSLFAFKVSTRAISWLTQLLHDPFSYRQAKWQIIFAHYHDVFFLQICNNVIVFLKSTRYDEYSALKYEKLWINKE